MTSTLRIASAHLDSEPTPYAQAIRVGRHTVVADEPQSRGGGDLGPAPYDLFLAALAACTSMTLRMYAERKGWELGAIQVDLVMTREGEDERIERTVTLAAWVGPDQRARLAEIAEKTPVTKTVKRGVAIHTTFA